jgi:hypothetical protein
LLRSEVQIADVERALLEFHSPRNRKVCANTVDCSVQAVPCHLLVISLMDRGWPDRPTPPMIAK